MYQMNHSEPVSTRKTNTNPQRLRDRALTALQRWGGGAGVLLGMLCTLNTNAAPNPLVLVCSPAQTVECGAAWDFTAPTVTDTAVFDSLVYDDSVNDLVTRFDPGTSEVGDEIILGGTARNLKSFVLEYWGTNQTGGASFDGAVNARLRFYKNDGTPSSGYATPGTVLFDSGDFPVGATARSTLTFNDFVTGAVTPLTGALPDSFTWSVQFSGLAANDHAGVDLYSPPVVGQDFPDYWQQVPVTEDPSGWSLRTNVNMVPMDFAAKASASDCPGQVEVVVTDTATNAACGTTFVATRTWKAIDLCGNTDTCSQTVTVVDTTPPTITCVGAKTVECATAWTFDDPSATDGCDGAPVLSIVSTTTNRFGACGLNFTAKRTWQATDACGNSSTCSQTVTTVDTTPPTITCRPDKTVECNTTWNFDTPTASDTCGNTTVAISSTVAHRSPCGNTYVTTRTWRATDACGNHADCSQTVTVVDTTPPRMVCGPAKAICTGAWTFDAPFAVDTCGNTTVIITSTVTNAPCGNTFTATRTWRATDDCGNHADCSQTVTVVVDPAIPPTITCVPAKTVECASVWSFDAPTANNGCGSGTVAIVSTTTNVTGHCGNTFDATRTWRATDACGNHADCSQTVTVVDTTPPTITCVPAKTVECGVAWDFDAPTAGDTCGNTTVTITGTETNATCGHTFVAMRTWRATDACGNHAECSQTVTVVDTTPPTITCLPSKTVECGVAWTFDAPTASDTCGNTTVIISDWVTNASCGNTFVATQTWRATDDCGNHAECSQTVTVVDTTPPTITCAPGKTVCTGAWDFDAPTASDTCGNTTITITSTVTNAPCGNTFTVTQTWRATDDCGNHADCSQTVTVVVDPTISPTITCAPGKTVECNTTWTFDAPTAGDTCGNTTIDVVSTTTNRFGSCGLNFTAKRTWKATDACGNSSTCSQIVTTVDTTPPTITCAPDKTVECNTTWNFDTPTASDTCGNTTVAISSTVAHRSPCGNTYVTTRTWRATDGCGNHADCSQTVTVVDTTPPRMVCAAAKAVCTGPWTFDAPFAVDTCGNTTVIITGTVTNAPCGNTFTATRTWRATDDCGNHADCSQTVTVVVDPTISPTITCLPAKTVECGVAWDFDAPTVGDTCGTTTVTITGTVTNATCGNTFAAMRTWRATDACGNHADCSQTVTVVDTTPPTITCVSGKTAQCGVAWDFDAPTAGDTCGNTTVTITGTETNATCGNTFVATRTWRATDGCGNHAECSQTVTVVDTTPPAITCVAAKTVECGTAWTFDEPSATDTCDGAPVVSIVNTVTNAADGAAFTATRTWKAIDACNNSAECSQTVTVLPETVHPSLTMIRTGNSVVLSWPATCMTYQLQAVPDLSAHPLTWARVLAPVDMVNGFYTVTVPMTDQQRYFRLQRP